MRLERVISGGQTGADRAGLDAAIALGIPHGGWCPRGRRVEDGRVPDHYGLDEAQTPDYSERTHMHRNVAEADATLVLTQGPPGSGSALTLRLAQQSGKPSLHVDLAAEGDPVRSVQDWLRVNGPRCLNVAGSRESTSPGIWDRARAALLGAFRPANPLAFDCETVLTAPGRLAPPVVCAALGDDAGVDVLHRDEARDRVEGALAGERLLVGHFVAYDCAVVCAEWPDLIPIVFDAYAADRVSDTGIREKLIHLAVGQLRGFVPAGTVDGKLEKLGYSLEELARRRLGVLLEKEGGWRLRYAELLPLPVREWPPEAVDYVRGDVFSTLGVWQEQERDHQYLDDEYRQVRAEFFLYLMSCWGLRTDQDGVREFATRTQQDFDRLAAELEGAGLVRRGKKERGGKKKAALVEAYRRLGLSTDFLRVTKSTKAVQARVVEAYTSSGRQVEMTGGGMRGRPQPKIDADVCERSGDPLLEKYAELSSLGKKLSTDVPLLSRPLLQPRFETLLETGRTSSSPNVQNLPTDFGVRECFEPRDGWVYAIGDYPQIELRTWAQVCLDVLGFSDMAEALRGGLDPHCQIASKILEISYEEAFVEFKQDPKGRVYYPRQSGKVCNFGCPGGLGVKRLVDYARKNYGVVLTEYKAGELREHWYASWSEARPYFDWVHAQTEAELPIRQLYSGRYRGGVGFCDASNGYFQALAADAMKAAGFLIARACYADPESPLYGGRPVNEVHDEFVVEVPDDDRAHDGAVELGRLMAAGAKPFIPDIPIEVEALLSRRWSKECKPVRDSNGRLIPWDLSMRRRAA